MHRPLYYLAISFAGGILMASHLETLPRWLMVAAVFIPAAAIIVSFICRSIETNRWRIALCALLLLAVFFAGSLRYLTHIASVVGGPLQHDERRSKMLVLEAVDNPEPTSTGSGFRWEAQILPPEDEMSCDEKSDNLAGFSVMVFSDEQGISPGGVYQVEGTIARPSPARNPDTFDYRRYLLHRGVGYVFYADGVNQLRPPSLWSIARLRQVLHRRVSSVLSLVLDESVVGMVSALTLGIRSDIPQPLVEDFRAVGLGHLLAVSGMHLGIVGLGLVHLSGLIVSKAKVTFVVIPALVVYCQLVGSRPSIWRAAVVFSAWLLSRRMSRRVDSLNILGGAAALLLAANPGALFDVGFQLSFAACWGLVCIAPRIAALVSCDLDDISLSWPAAAFAASSAAYMTTAPLLLHHFGECSPWALLVNPLFIPFLAPVLTGAWVAALWALPGLSAVVPFGATRPLALLIGTVRWLAGSFSQHTAAPGTLTVLFIYASIWALFPPPAAASLQDCAVRLRAKKLRYASIAKMTLLWLFVSWLVITAPGLGSGLVRVTLFDVGQGDCILIEEPQGGTLLIDTGPPDWRGGSVLHREVLPYLMRRRIQSIDHLILTHSHLDHIGGTDDLMREVRVENLWLAGADLGRRSEGPCPEVWGRWADEYDGSLRWVLAGDGAQIGRLNLEVIWPTEEVGSHLDLNERSVAVRVSYGDWTLLAMGDVEGLGEHMLTHQLRGQLSASVLKVGHHGGSRSTGSDFLKEVRPQVALVPVGRNPYGMPCEGTLGRLKAAGARVLTSQREGGIILHTDGTRWWLQTMLPAAAD